MFFKQLFYPISRSFYDITSLTVEQQNEGLKLNRGNTFKQES